MKFNTIKIVKTGLVAMVAFTGATSCNKDVPEVVPIAPAPAVSGRTIADTVNNDANFTILKAAIARASSGTSAFGASLSTLLSDRTAVFTLFAPTDAAFQLSGIPNVAAISTLRTGFLDTVLRYHIVGGQKITSAEIPTTFPNIQLPTQLVLSNPSALLPPGLRMSIFPSKRGTNLWANNVPFTQADIMLGNGVVHRVATLVSPPSTTVKGILASNPAKFSILLAAIKRADVGQTPGPTTQLDSAINYAPANLTVFAPNNDAFRALFPPGTPDATIIATLNNDAAFPVQTVRAIIAYHLLGVRAFSVNFAAGPAPVSTQLVVAAGTPPVPVLVTYGGANFAVRGVGPGSVDAPVITRDQHAINGVVHEIGQVLRFQ